MKNLTLTLLLLVLNGFIWGAGASAQIAIPKTPVKTPKESGNAPGYSVHDLGEALRHGDHRTIFSLIPKKHGPNQSLRFNSGETPLLAAVKSDKTSVVKSLIKMGANVNGSDNNGKTPLMQAIEEHNPFMMQALMELGANPSITNRNGENAKAYLKREIEGCMSFQIIATRVLDTGTMEKDPVSTIGEGARRSR